MIAMRIKSDANVPCKNCPDRVLHCHSSCEKYKSYRAIIEQNKAELSEEKAEKDFVYNVKREVRKRYIRRRPGDK